MPKISVIMPVYNLKKYLNKCIHTILSQTFQDFEIICVDDGSTDNTVEILEQYQKQDNRFIILKQNHGGVGMARNFGLTHAKGKYIQFLDGDDYYEPEMFQVLYEQAEKYDADISVCSCRKVDDEGNITETGNPNFPLNLEVLPLEKPFNKYDLKEDFLNSIGSVPWNKLYRRDMVVSNGLKYLKFIGCEDLCFVRLASICADKIIATNQELINYRYNRPGSVQSYRASHTIDTVKAGLYIKDFLIKKGLFEEFEQAYLKATINSIRGEMALCNNEQYNKFLEELKELMPNDWQVFNSALKQDFITPEYIDKFIGNKRVVLWGASLFIQEVLAKEKQKNPKILGFIDKNSANQGKMCGNYQIFSPQSLPSLGADAVLLTVFSNNETIYESLKTELKTYPNLELLPNIFEKGNKINSNASNI